jgi:hypothetical protein
MAVILTPRVQIVKQSALIRRGPDDGVHGRGNEKLGGGGLTEPEGGNVSIHGTSSARAANGRRTGFRRADGRHGVRVLQPLPGHERAGEPGLRPGELLGMSKAACEERAPGAVPERAWPTKFGPGSPLLGGLRQRVAIAPRADVSPIAALRREQLRARPSGAVEVLGVLVGLEQDDAIAAAPVTHDIAVASKAAGRPSSFRMERSRSTTRRTGPSITRFATPSSARSSTRPASSEFLHHHTCASKGTNRDAH